MVLKSMLFRNDPKPEAAAVSDPAHVLPNATGLHVAKIQVALIHLDGAAIGGQELQRAIYGPSTSKAVLAYKQKRNIVNRSYQTKPDHIVGKMTIASLDRDMLAIEPLSGQTRIQPLSRTQSLTTVPADTRAKVFPLVAFKIGADLGFQGGPQIIIPTGPPVPPLFINLPPGQTQSFQVVNGKGGAVGCTDNDIAFVSDPAEPLAHSGTMPVFKDPHIFSVTARSGGRTAIVATNKSRTGFGDMLTVIVQIPKPTRQVSIAFHFLGGTSAVATKRDKNSIAAAVGVMNELYQKQTNITFRIAGIDAAPIVVPGLDAPPLLSLTERTRDWNAVTKFRSASADFNVFFTAKIDLIGPTIAIALSSNPRTKQFVSRDCIMQDNLASIEFGRALAHEAGHILGENDNSQSGDLMNKSDPGKSIPLEAALRMNDLAAK